MIIFLYFSDVVTQIFWTQHLQRGMVHTLRCIQGEAHTWHGPYGGNCCHSQESSLSYSQAVSPISISVMGLEIEVLRSKNRRILIGNVRVLFAYVRSTTRIRSIHFLLRVMTLRRHYSRMFTFSALIGPEIEVLRPKNR